MLTWLLFGVGVLLLATVGAYSLWVRRVAAERERFAENRRSWWLIDLMDGERYLCELRADVFAPRGDVRLEVAA